MRGKKIFVLLSFIVSFWVFFLAGGLDLAKEEIKNIPQIQKQAAGTVGEENFENKGSEEVGSLKTENNLSDNTNTKAKTEVNSLKSAKVPEVVKKSNVEKIIAPPAPLITEDKSGLGEKGAVSESDIIFFTNLERGKEGLKPLNKNNLLMEAAAAKVKHMFDNQYFEHVAPSGEDVSYWVGNVKYKYISVGENLAMGGFKNGEDMVRAWMESPGHRANILKEGFEEIGVAVGYGKINGDDVCLGVQIFAIPFSSCPAIDETLKTQIDSLESVTKKTEETLKSMQSTLSSSHPTTPSEYDEYNNLIGQYNELVAKQNGLIEQIKFTVEVYNNQVKAFNSCIEKN